MNEPPKRVEPRHEGLEIVEVPRGAFRRDAYLFLSSAVPTVRHSPSPLGRHRGQPGARSRGTRERRRRECEPSEYRWTSCPIRPAPHGAFDIAGAPRVCQEERKQRDTDTEGETSGVSLGTSRKGIP